MRRAIVFLRLTTIIITLSEKLRFDAHVPGTLYLLHENQRIENGYVQQCSFNIVRYIYLNATFPFRKKAGSVIIVQQEFTLYF